VGVITLNRPSEEPADLRIVCGAQGSFPGAEERGRHQDVVLAGRRQFLLGRDVPEITARSPKWRCRSCWNSRRMTAVVKAMRHCRSGDRRRGRRLRRAGAILAMAADLRYGAPDARWPSSFTRVGLPAATGRCTILPRIIGQGRAAELLYSGRSMFAEEGFAWGFFNRLASRRWPRP